EGCPVVQGATLERNFSVTPDISTLRDRRNIALDGQLKVEDTNLASSTLFTNPNQRGVFGVVVAYVIRVKLHLGTLSGDLQTEVPFTLMNAPPDDSEFPGAHPKHIDSIDENTRLVIEECTRMTIEEEHERSETPELGIKRKSSKPKSKGISHPLENIANIPEPIHSEKGDSQIPNSNKLIKSEATNKLTNEARRNSGCSIKSEEIIKLRNETRRGSGCSIKSEEISKLRIDARRGSSC
ncbi:unnamed protein product, partial [Meganyctiphanes norvegica]